MPEPKKVSAEEAIKEIERGDRIFIPGLCAEPQTLVETLIKEKNEGKKLELMVDMQPFGKCEYANPNMLDRFFILSYTPPKILGEAFKRKQGDYFPCNLSQFEKLVENDEMPIDVAFFQLSPPNKEGYCSFGTSVLYYKTVIEKAKLVIAEINSNTPITLGNCFVHLSELDYIVETSRPIIERKAPSMGNVAHKIVENIAELVTDGATIQVGIGLPEMALSLFDDKKNLGVHSGLIVEAMMDLMEKGVINNLHKSIDKEKSVGTCITGTKRLFDFVHCNEAIKMMPSSYTHSNKVISKINNFIAINSAVEVDLTGQINAEVVGDLQVGGTGGLMDFVRGAFLSPGGKSIIAFPSTAKKGKFSRIVPRVNTVTCPRSDVHYIVTEHGIANMRGKTSRQRAEALISIASPDFQDKLSRYNFS